MEVYNFDDNELRCFMFVFIEKIVVEIMMFFEIEVGIQKGWFFVNYFFRDDKLFKILIFFEIDEFVQRGWFFMYCFLSCENFNLFLGLMLD